MGPVPAPPPLPRPSSPPLPAPKAIDATLKEVEKVEKKKEKKQLKRSRSSTSSIEIIEPTTASTSKKKMGPLPSPPPPPPPAKVQKVDPDASISKTTATSSKKRKEAPAAPAAAETEKKGKKAKKEKPRLSLEKVIEKTSKLSVNSLHVEFPTISSYVSHLNDHEPLAPYTKDKFEDGIFKGLRVMVIDVNYDPVNKLSVGIRDNIRRLVERGATVVKPEDFVVGAPKARTTSEWKEVADEESWTTHIIPFELGVARVPPFSKILSAIGGGLKDAAALGDYVKIVHYSWVSMSISSSMRVDEGNFLWEGDPRKKKVEPVRRERKEAIIVEKPASTDSKGKGKAKLKRGEVDPESGSESEMAVDGMGPNDQFLRLDAPCSPLGPDDWPTPSPSPEPAPGPSRHDPNLSANSTTDPIIDLTLTQPSQKPETTYDGLQEQLAILKEFGDSVDFEAMLDSDDKNERGKTDQEVEDMIYSTRDMRDDNETDDEKEEAEKNRNTRGRRSSSSSKKEKLKLEKVKKTDKYVCELSSTGGVREVGPNDLTAKTLEALAQFCEKGSFRERGYKMGAGALRNTKTYIEHFADAKLIRGIGDSLASKIVEIVKTGSHRRLAQRTPRDDAIDLFKGIYGVGQTRAETFFNLGCKTLEDVSILVKDLTDSQKLGVKYYDDLQKRIPRDEVTELYSYVLETAKRIDPNLEVYCMGAYRRGAPDCGDIDLLVTRDTSDGKDHSSLILKLVEDLTKQRIIRHNLTEPDDWLALDAKLNGLCALPGGLMRRIDVLGVPWDELPAALIYFTGNDYFNRSMRLKARHLGYRLNQRGLYKDVMRGKGGLKLTEGKKVHCATEKDIFIRLGVTWRPPEERLP